MSREKKEYLNQKDVRIHVKWRVMHITASIVFFAEIIFIFYLSAEIDRSPGNFFIWFDLSLKQILLLIVAGFLLYKTFYFGVLNGPYIELYNNKLFYHNAILLRKLVPVKDIKEISTVSLRTGTKLVLERDPVKDIVINMNVASVDAETASKELKRYV